LGVFSVFRSEKVAHLKQTDIQEVFELFEKELNTLQRLPQVEKMEMRKRIADVLKPALLVINPSPRVILHIIDDKLSDVLRLSRDRFAFRKKLAELLSEKLKDKSLWHKRKGP